MPDKKSFYMAAAIDIGATSTRLLLAEVHGPDDIRQFDVQIRPLALGADTFVHNHILPDTLRVLCRCIADFVGIARDYKAKFITIVATSAIREASNRDIVIDRIEHTAGQPVLLLSEEEEIRIIYRSLLPTIENISNPQAHTLALDLGGGSTELILFGGTDILYASTRRLGTSRLLHILTPMETTFDLRSMRDSMVRSILDEALGAYRRYSVSDLVLVNDPLVDAVQTLPEVTTSPVGLKIPAHKLLVIAREAADMSVDNLSKLYALQIPQAEHLLTAALVTTRVLERLPVEEVHLVRLDFLHGILTEAEMRQRGIDPESDFVRHTLTCATVQARRYGVNMNHAEQVRKLAEWLFIGLRKLLDLDDHAGLILNIAAIMHDTGRFISETAHHKHSEYLIRWAELPGISDVDREITALVARYHRRAHPDTHHAAFMALSTPSRLLVIKLAAILRMADALDRAHASRVQDLKVKVEQTEIEIIVTTNEDMSMEQVVMREKSSLFIAATGLGVKLRTKMDKND